MNHKKHLLLLFTLFLVVAPGIFFSAQKIEVVSAAGGDELLGWAWSDNVGWISFSSQNKPDAYAYGVKIIGENLTGYAWSDNIGWIYFGEETSVIRNITDSGLTQDLYWARLEGGKVKGWARACAVFVSGCSGQLNPQRGDWDGWISLSGTNYGVTYETTINGARTFKGFAWGGDGDAQALGWIDFNVNIASDGEPPCTTCGTDPVHTSVTDDDLNPGECWLTINDGSNPPEIKKGEGIADPSIGTVAFSVNNTSGGNGAYSYSWKNNLSQNCFPPSGPVLDCSHPQSGTYQVSVDVSSTVNGTPATQTIKCPILSSIAPETPVGNAGEIAVSSGVRATFWPFGTGNAILSTFSNGSFSNPGVKILKATDSCLEDTFDISFGRLYKINIINGSEETVDYTHHIVTDEAQFTLFPSTIPPENNDSQEFCAPSDNKCSRLNMHLKTSAKNSAGVTTVLGSGYYGLEISASKTVGNTSLCKDKELESGTVRMPVYITNLRGGSTSEI